MKKICFLLLILYVSSARADDLEQIYVKRIAHARSAAEITQLETLHERTQIARRACRIQIEKELAPLACFESLDFETKWGLHTPKSRLDLTFALDRLCAQASAHLKIPPRIQVDKHLSPNCRRSVERAMEVRSYREERFWSEN
jgi:hypothetical protein